MDKKEFYVYQEDLIRYEINKDLATISQLVGELNLKYCMEDMKKLRTTQITNFLKSQGYLYLDETGRKRPTRKGNILGINVGYISDEMENKYQVNFYNKRAQGYILDNLYDVF